eukprot:UN07756
MQRSNPMIFCQKSQKFYEKKLKIVDFFAKNHKNFMKKNKNRRLYKEVYVPLCFFPKITKVS